MSHTLILTFNRCSVLLSDGVMNNAAIAESILLVCPRATTKLIRHDEAIDESLSTDGEESDTIFIRSSNSVAVGSERGRDGGRKEREGENDNNNKTCHTIHVHVYYVLKKFRKIKCCWLIHFSPSTLLPVDCIGSFLSPPGACPCNMLRNSARTR